jgi:hypothetical protein
MKTARTLFLILVTVLSLFVSITGLIADIDLASKILLLLFLPVTGYLFFVLMLHLSHKTPVFELKSGLRRVIIYYCFIITSTVVSLSFLSSRTLPQFASALFFSPMALYFLVLVWPRHKEALLVSEGGKVAQERSGVKSLLAPAINIDVDRRNFLKLIGSAGILALILGVFSKRSGIPSLWGNVGSYESLTIKDSSGNIIDPAERSPTEGYHICCIDDAVPAYFGFTDKDGAWFIMKETEDGHYLYFKGDSGFDASWDKRGKLNYADFEDVF